MDRRRERFLNYGINQVTKALVNIDRLKRFAETSNYVTEEWELRKITDSLKNKVAELEDHYFSDSKSDNSFSLAKSDFEPLNEKGFLEAIGIQKEEIIQLQNKWEKTHEETQLIKFQHHQILAENNEIKKRINDLDITIQELKAKLKIERNS